MLNLGVIIGSLCNSILSLDPSFPSILVQKIKIPPRLSQEYCWKRKGLSYAPWCPCPVLRMLAGEVVRWSRGKHGPDKWISSCLALASLWDWATCGGSPIYATRTAEVMARPNRGPAGLHTAYRRGNGDAVSLRVRGGRSGASA